MGRDEFGDPGRDFRTETRSVENTIVPDLRLKIVRPLFRRNIDADLMSGFGLSDTRNIVILAFNREQRNRSDYFRLHRFAAMSEG